MSEKKKEVRRLRLGMERKSGKKEIEKEVERILLSEYQHYFRLAMSFVHQEADACDIVQTGAYKAVRGSGSLKKKEYAATWIYRIMLNEIFRFCRQPKYEPLEAASSIGREDEYEEFDLHRALDALPAADKAVIELRYFEDMKLEQIAEILQENVNTVKSRLYRSLKKLRLELEEE